MKHYTFTIRISPSQNPYAEEDAPEASLTLAIIGEPTLEDVAGLLLDAIGFAADHLFGFHENLKEPIPTPNKRSFSLMADQFPEDCPNEKGVENTLATELFEPGKTVLFHFDYGDDWRFRVTCDSLTEAQQGQKQGVRILSRTGKFPEQYPDFDEDE